MRAPTGGAPRGRWMRRGLVLGLVVGAVLAARELAFRRNDGDPPSTRR
ncbi:MAG: hypothetical protein U5R31_14540 [Acidimicrobiia bacterium]|nr:hypothetical protein [Acidimicrobiia bacterium]